jgi:radical SAM protein with 4Fe4S-binding SPASM domain
MERGVMREETFSLVLKSMALNASSIKVVVLYHGGEPLLHKGFADMVRRVKALSVPFVKTVSNGMLMTQATLVGLIESGLDVIEFSLDGESPEENDLIRRDCDYTTVVRNVKRLIDYKRQRGTSTPQIYLSSTRFIDKHTHHEREQDPTPPEYLLKEFAEPYASGIAGFKCTWAMKWPHMEILDELYDLYQDPYHREPNNYCDHVVNTMTVRWNGDVVGCCYDLTSRYVLGNVHTHDLATIWNNERYLHMRQSIEEMTFVPLCANCNVVKPNVYLTLKPKVLAKMGKGDEEQAVKGQRVQYLPTTGS